jgi:hypothetical protein
MHGMLKRAAASAIPTLLGLAVSPASALAAPHTGRAVAGPVMSSRMVHERLVRLPLSGTSQGRLVGTTGTAETTADTRRCNGTDAESAATPVILTFLPTFTAIPVINGGIVRLARFSPVKGSVNGAPANGIIAFGNDEKIIGNHIMADAGSGIDKNGSTTFSSGYRNNVVGNAPLAHP